jgi:cardiolipin synthase
MTPNLFFDIQLSRLRSAGYDGRALGAFWRALWEQAALNAADRPDLVGELTAIRWVGLAGTLLVAAGMLAERVPWPAALLPLPAAWIILCAWVGVELGLVRHPLTGRRSAAIGPANVLTLLRGWAAVPMLILAVFQRGPTPLWVALGISGGITDLIDGTVAVRLGHESRLGRLLDPVLDAIFFSAAAFSFVIWGLLPWWLAVIVAVRYFVPVFGGIGLMLARGRTLPVRHTPWGQRATLAIGLALVATWISTTISMPGWFLPALYAMALLCMALALVGIARRAPG